MGKWKTWADGDTIPTDDATSYEDLNHWLDYRDYADDTHAASWGASEKGRLWWNTTDLRYKFWDGSAVQTLPGSTSGVSLPFVVVDADDGSDLIQKVVDYEDTMAIWVPPGDYDIGADIIEINVADDTHPKILGAGSECCRISGTGTKIFDVLQTAFPTGGVTVPLTISGFHISHAQSNATDVTLDLMNAQADLFDITAAPTSDTRGVGIGVLAGSGTDQSPAGRGCTWNRLTMTYYGVAFKTGLDHSSLIDCVANSAYDKAFYLIDPKTGDEGNNYANFITLIHCQTTSTATTRGTVYPFYFVKPAYCSVLGGSHEDSTALTNNIFTIGGDLINYDVPVFGFKWHSGQNDQLTNDYNRVRFWGCSSTYNTESAVSEKEDVNADPWPDPTGGAWESRRVVMHNAHATFAAAPYRVYYYINGGWHYSVLT